MRFLLPLLLLAGAAPPGRPLAAPQPVFDADAFFAGRTEGHAELKVILHAAKAVHVIGQGRMTADGTLVLDQIVAQQGKAPEKREWRLRETRPGHYVGTLSDASGPVAGEVSGNCLRLAYPMKGDLEVEQRLYLQPGGRTALNRMKIRKFGLTVARLDETIRKLD